MPPDQTTLALSAPAAGGSTPQLSASERSAAQRKHKDMLKSFNEKAKVQAKNRVRGIEKYRNTNRDDPVKRKRMDARVSKEKTKFYIQALEDHVFHQLLRSERESPSSSSPSLPQPQPAVSTSALATLPAHVPVSIPAPAPMTPSLPMPLMLNGHAIASTGQAYGAQNVLNIHTHTTHMDFAMNDHGMMDVDSHRKDWEIERQRTEIEQIQRTNHSLQEENNLLKTGQFNALIPGIVANIGFSAAAGNILNPVAQPSNVPMTESNDVINAFDQNVHPNMNAIGNDIMLPTSVANTYPVNAQDDTMTTTTATTAGTTPTQQVNYKITNVEEETSAPDMDLTNDHNQLLSSLLPLTPTIRTVKLNLEIKVRQETPYASFVSHDPPDFNPFCLPNTIFKNDET